jgi:hypothetical protein
MKDARGVGIEGDGKRRAAEEARALDDLRDHALVAQVHTVEVADGGNDGGVSGREFVELAVDLHAV